MIFSLPRQKQQHNFSARLIDIIINFQHNLSVYTDDFSDFANFHYVC